MHGTYVPEAWAKDFAQKNNLDYRGMCQRASRQGATAFYSARVKGWTLGAKSLDPFGSKEFSRNSAGAYIEFSWGVEELPPSLQKQIVQSVFVDVRGRGTYFPAADKQFIDQIPDQAVWVCALH